jgi:hypothetical protein
LYTFHELPRKSTQIHGRINEFPEFPSGRPIGNGEISFRGFHGIVYPTFHANPRKSTQIHGRINYFPEFPEKRPLEIWENHFSTHYAPSYQRTGVTPLRCFKAL